MTIGIHEWKHTWYWQVVLCHLLHLWGTWVDCMVPHPPFQYILPISKGLSRYCSCLFLLVEPTRAKDGSSSKMLCLVAPVVWRYVCDLHRRTQISLRLICLVPMTMSSSMQRSAYACAYSSQTIAVTVVIHASSQVVSWKYWSLCCGCKPVCQDWSDEVDEQNWLTRAYLQANILAWS